MADTKQRILRELYYDEGGFMSAANFYKDAKRVNPDITYADVREWLAKSHRSHRAKTPFTFES